MMKNQQKYQIMAFFLSFSSLSKILINFPYLLVKLLSTQTQQLKGLFSTFILNFECIQGVIQIPLDYIPLRKHASFCQRCFSSNRQLQRITSFTNEFLKDFYTSDSGAIMQWSSPCCIFCMNISSILQTCIYDWQRSYGAGDHQQSLSRLCQCTVDILLTFGNKLKCFFICALIDLHTFKPNLMMNFLLLTVLFLHFLDIRRFVNFSLQNDSIYFQFIISLLAENYQMFNNKFFNEIYSPKKNYQLYFIFSLFLTFCFDYNKSFFQTYFRPHSYYQFIKIKSISKMNLLTKNLKFFVGLHSRKLVESSMLLRPQHNRYTKLHPIKVEKYVRTTQAPEPLAFKIHKSSQQISFDLPHPKPLGTLQALPFNVERSLSGNLPVYVDYKNRRAIKRTIIRKISGDIEKLADELRKVCSNAEVRVKVGHIVIPGIHKESVNMLLYKLGL